MNTVLMAWTTMVMGESIVLILTAADLPVRVPTAPLRSVTMAPTMMVTALPTVTTPNVPSCQAVARRIVSMESTMTVTVALTASIRTASETRFAILVPAQAAVTMMTASLMARTAATTSMTMGMEPWIATI